MHTHRKRRVYGVLAMLLGVCVAVLLAIYALGKNIDLYLTPTQLFLHAPPEGQVFRMGGFVQKGSIRHLSGGLTLRFVLTDYDHSVLVQYQGLLPTLFREGQGAVVQGRWQQGLFIADQVLAKHDSTYKPPGT